MFKSGTFPDILKYADIAPVSKTPVRQIKVTTDLLVLLLIGISNLSIFSKVFEKFGLHSVQFIHEVQNVKICNRFPLKL